MEFDKKTCLHEMRSNVAPMLRQNAQDARDRGETNAIVIVNLLPAYADALAGIIEEHQKAMELLQRAAKVIQSMRMERAE